MTSQTPSTHVDPGPAEQEIIDLFDELGLELETKAESKEERLARLVSQVESGESTLDSFRRSLEPFRTTATSQEQEILDIFEDLGIGAPNDERLARLVGEVGAGRTLQNITTALEPFATTGIGTSTEEIQENEEQVGEGVGGAGDDPDTVLTILTSKEMTWNFDEEAGKWYVSYGLPGSDLRMVFEASPDNMDDLFGVNQRPRGAGTLPLAELLSAEGAHFAGNISKMSGTGSFEDEVRRISALALNNGELPSWATETAQIMDIIFIAQATDKPADWVIDQIAETDMFRERFVGIESLMAVGGVTTRNAITGYLEYEHAIQSAITAIGGTLIITPELIGGLLTRNLSASTVVQATVNFKRMQDHAPAIAAFNRILVDQGKAPITTLQDMYDFVTGQADDETYDIWEASSISEAAEAAGLGDIFTAEDAMEFALQTEGLTSLSDAMGAFQGAARLLLQFRNEIDLGRFDLDQEDIIDLSLGRPPSSGMDTVEIQANMSRAVLAGQASRRERSKPFVGFTDQGTAQRASLRGLRTTQ